MGTMRALLNDMAPEAREALLAHSRRVDFPGRTRTVEERRRADRFWIIENGTVHLDAHVPGHRAAVVDTLASGKLLGCSHSHPPGPGPRHRRHRRTGALQGGLCRRTRRLDRRRGRDAQRLSSARTRILDLSAPSRQRSAARPRPLRNTP